MGKLKFRYFIVAILLSVTAAVASILKHDNIHDVSGIANLQAIPNQIGKWRGQDVPLDKIVYEILETRAIIHRSFIKDSGDDVFLSIVHYSDTKVDFHAPEACIGGRGLKTVKTIKSITLFSGEKKRKLNVAKMITTRTVGQTLTYYFFKAGHFVDNNYVKMRLSIAANQLTNNDTRGSLIRISTSLTPGNEMSAESLLSDFLEDLFPYIQQSL